MRQCRPAAILCLIAFLMLTVSANWHTHEDADGCAAPRAAHRASIGIPHYDNCAACEIIANNIGITTFTSAFSIHTNYASVSAATLPVFILISVDLINGASRSPPSA